MNKKAWRPAMILLLALLLAGCDLLPGDLIGLPTDTPEPASDEVVFTAPYRAALDEGELVPGALLQYVGQDDQGILVRIDGQDAYKKTGDSFYWRGLARMDAEGTEAAGVELDYKLRVVGVVLNVFQAWGEVGIVVSEPSPVMADLPEEAPLKFSAAVASYTVARGANVPGTTYTYLGKTDKGAEFGGVEGYAYREVADSLDWAGQVRPNVYSDLSMRVSKITDEEVTLLGTATVWILP